MESYGKNPEAVWKQIVPGMSRLALDMEEKRRGRTQWCSKKASIESPI
jgi:hypothetical protein